ncbi:NB-ARC domain-containing disease resistance protein, putative isoform 2 [Theobroma cacao]|uniref:NB-ARC domain-containing disease resistance protein, putative isoform 2 n=1 Tax=Theobroma cacao TaxID=3641 RepID=A0A061F1R7_THECC|nr:NB-ARC domain-containing disease resistance protein, putative isoform 2 [Theobroma cacao]
MEDVGTGAAANISSQIAKGIFQEIKRHIKYVIIYKKNVDKFDHKLQMLKAERTSVQQEVGAADRNGEKIKADVQHWNKTVDKVIDEEVRKVKDLQDKAKNKCFIGMCPNIKSRYQLSRKAEEVVVTVDDLIQRKGQFNGVGYRDVPEVILDASPKEFETFKSREKVFNDIMEAVKDAAVSMIGVHGMAGVGKTSLVNEVARQVQEVKLFDSVVTVNVTQTPDIQKIQDQIAELLGLRLEDKSTVVRARRLCERLKKEKQVLVVLDNVWKKLDLEEVGIPFENQHKGCKILLTSRDQNVFSNEMDVKETFPIDVLDDEEAWDLFKQRAGDNVESVELRSTAIEVAKRCARLPLAIATVARALRNKSLFAWKDALRQLQRPSPNNFNGIAAAAYSAIELSYNHLESDELKQAFLLCTLLRRDSSIDYLLQCAIGLGLINGVSTVEEARNRLLTIVSNLKASCLLLDSNLNDRSFDMHDLVYDVVMSIASKDNHVFALNEKDVLKDWPDGEIMKKWNKIYLKYPSIIGELPDELNCPEVVLFILLSKDLSLKMPPNFFNETKNLKVLDLSDMQFSSLPLSTCLFASLRALFLNQCELRDITIIGELKNLEILNLSYSDIKILPKEIGRLVKLKRLDLGHCTKLKIILPGVLSSLSKLEELYMGGTFIQWEVGGHANQRGNIASLAELNTLSCLTTLEVHIPDPEAMSGGLLFKDLQKLERYKIFIGKEWEWFGEYEYSRTLKLKLSTSIDHLGHEFKLLLKRIEGLYLDELEGVKIAMQEFIDEESLPYLKNLHIQNGSMIQYIINDDGAANKNEFLQLQSLTLQNLPQLISFCSEDENGSTSRVQHELPLFSEKSLFTRLENLRLSSISVERIWHDSFCNHENLTRLIIEGCGNLKRLLSFSMSRKLVHLKCFEIIGCKCLREIIFAEDIEEESKDKILFPQLNSLKLQDLQHLIGFWLGHQNIEFPSLKSLKIEKCPELKGFIYESTMEGSQSVSSQVLFDEKVAFPSLEELFISKLRNMKMIWQNPLAVNSFHKLQEMEVEECDQLLTIFPSNMLRAFQGLQTLKVQKCVSVEEVFEVGRSNMEETGAVTTQLRQLYIWYLPNLKNIWKNDPKGIFTFENLRVISVWDCCSLKNVFPASVAKVLPQLRDLLIADCRVEEIVSKEEGLETVVTFVFDQVCYLFLWRLPDLKCFYPGAHTTKWPMLKKLKVSGCDKMKILGTERLSISDTAKVDGQLESTLIQPPLLLAEKVIPKLEKLSLNSDDIAMISESQFSRSLFREIKILRVSNSGDESVVFPITFLERFDNLEKLVVIYYEFKELFCNERDSGMETYAGTLPTIRSLKLIRLHNLKHLWKQDVQVDRILPNLETLKVHLCDKLISLGSSSASFQNLLTLDVWSCGAMICLVTSLAVQSLAQLKKLRIRECIFMKEIVGNVGDEATYDIVFSKLKSLELCDLPQIESFCSSNHTFGFPSLEEVIVSRCPQLEIFCKGVLNAPMLQRVQVTDKDGKGYWGGDLNSTVQQLYAEKVGYKGVEYVVLSEFSKSIEIWKDNLQGVLDFVNLKHLEVCDCNNLKYILTVSMALDLQQLRVIKVNNCPMMEHIITNEEAEEAAMNSIVLPRLQQITLESCSNLRSFCLGSIIMECPSLQLIHVDDCPEMFAMASTFAAEKDAETVAAFFNDKQVAFPQLEKLTLKGMTNCRKIWPDQLVGDSFCKLNDLWVLECNRLLNIFPLSMRARLQNLEDFRIRGCDSLEEIFEHEALNTNDLHSVTATQSIAEETTTNFVFPTLTYLKLYMLPRLRSFCSMVHTTEWPSLKKMWIYGCHKMEIFASENIRSFGESTNQQPLFWVNEVTFPNLEELKLEWNDIMKEIWHGQLRANFFYKLKVLELIHFPDKSAVFPHCFIQSLPNLEKLVVSEASFSHIFHFEGFDGEKNRASAITSLNELVLSELPELTHLWKEEYHPIAAFCELRTLQVRDCGKLKILAPSAVSFENLTTLEVSRCHGYVNLIACSTAKSLVQLTRMTITDCEMIEKIIACESEEVKGDIVFTELKYLQLSCLPNMASFCLGDHNLEFPILEKMIVRECPKMKIFCQGDLSTPQLQKVILTEDGDEENGQWEGDLKTTIKRMFEEEEA